MKKFIQSKGLVALLLAIACVVIIMVCLIVELNKSSKFIPEDTSAMDNTATSSIHASSAAETSQPTTESTDAAAYLPAPTSSNHNEDYPKVVSETDDEVMVDFTETKKPTETAPPTPEGKTIIEDPGPDHPVNSTPEITAPATEAPTTAVTATEAPPSTQPETGSGNGAVYDPVFGWVEPGAVNQSGADSDGDPNKMVGDMGQ